MKRFYLFLLLLILSLTSISCVETKITDDDKKLLFTLDNIADYTEYHYTGLEKCESFSKISFLNFLNQYQYTFDSSKVKDNPRYLYINSNFHSYPTVISAKSNMKTQYNAFKLGFKISGKDGKLKEDNGFFTLGDENYHSFVMNKESTVGNIIVTRIGKKVLQIAIVGLYFDDPELLEESAAATIENIRKFKDKTK